MDWGWGEWGSVPHRVHKGELDCFLEIGLVETSLCLFLLCGGWLVFSSAAFACCAFAGRAFSCGAARVSGLLWVEWPVLPLSGEEGGGAEDEGAGGGAEGRQTGWTISQWSRHGGKC